MKQSINFSGFVDAFRAHARENQFSFQGLRVLFEYLEQYEEDTGEEIELDVIGLCCDYAESSLEDIAREYSRIFDTIDEAEDWLGYQTGVCGHTYENTIVYALF